MNWIKRKWNDWKKPTPATWRKIGDTFLLISTAFAGTMIIREQIQFGMAIEILGVIGKLLTDFAVEKDAE